MNFSVKSFGCKINKYNSNKLIKKLKGNGLKYKKNIFNIDYLIIYSCSVRNNVINKIYSIFGKLNKKCNVILLGCVLNKKYIKKNFKCIKLISNNLKEVISYIKK
ncbi:hypothetical protein ACT2CC_00080 [Candidatus Vidania fulgoroideorum]